MASPHPRMYKRDPRTGTRRLAPMNPSTQKRRVRRGRTPPSSLQGIKQMHNVSLTSMEEDSAGEAEEQVKKKYTDTRNCSDKDDIRKNFYHNVIRWAVVHLFQIFGRLSGRLCFLRTRKEPRRFRVFILWTLCFYFLFFYLRRRRFKSVESPASASFGITANISTERNGQKINGSLVSKAHVESLNQAGINETGLLLSEESPSGQNETEILNGSYALLVRHKSETKRNQNGAGTSNEHETRSGQHFVLKNDSAVMTKDGLDENGRSDISASVNGADGKHFPNATVSVGSVLRKIALSGAGLTRMEKLILSSKETMSTKLQPFPQTPPSPPASAPTKSEHIPKPYRPEIPKLLEHNLADVSEPFDSDRNVPYFWHVALSGGTAMEKIFGSCYHFVQAADITGRGSDDALDVIQRHGNMYINVDVTNRKDIAHAKALGLLSRGLADVVVTTTLHESAEIFTADHKGVLFTILHHPIERAVSMYYYLRQATNDPGYRPEIANMTIEEYARSGFVERNWLTRFLANRRRGSLNREHLAIAMEVLRRKCLIGLLPHFAASVDRFEQYFGWKAAMGSDKAKECRDLLVEGKDRRHYHPTYPKGSEVWKLLRRSNRFDLELYQYAEQLFLNQAQLIVTDEELQHGSR